MNTLNYKALLKKRYLLTAAWLLTIPPSATSPVPSLSAAGNKIPQPDSMLVFPAMSILAPGFSAMQVAHSTECSIWNNTVETTAPYFHRKPNPQPIHETV